jgi:hypothetical protein
MANHVSSYIELYEANDAARAHFKKFVDKLVENEEDPIIAIQELTGVPFDENDETTSYRSYMIDHVGAKWLIVEDHGEEHLSTTTAWDSPDSMFETLCQQLKELDPEVKISMTYDDEMPNFVGVSTFNGKFDDEPNTEHWDAEYYGSGVGVRLDMSDEEICEAYDISEDDEDAIYDKQYELRDEFYEAWHDVANSEIKWAFNDEEREDG